MPKSESIHSSALVIDSHNDTIVAHIRRRNRSISDSQNTQRHKGIVTHLRGVSNAANVQINLPKMRTGGIDAAFFAVDVTRAWKNHLTYALDAFGYFNMEIADEDEAVIALTASDIERAKSEGKLAAIMVIENSDGTEGSLNVLHMLYEVGVRSIGLTHDPSSIAASGNAETRTGGGLTRFGVSLVKEMNQLGMLVDVSHISEPGFWDVIETTVKPLIASHANCKALCDHPRNLTDKQIQALAETGGVMGVTFVPRFVETSNPTFDRLLDHIDHVVQQVGPDHIGIGSDFDGGGTLVKDATVFPQFTEGLLSRDYSEENVRKIMGENHLRVLRDTIGE